MNVRASRLEIAVFLIVVSIVVIAALLFNGPIIGIPSEGLGPSPDLR
jgi:hypothetical protein